MNEFGSPPEWVIVPTGSGSSQGLHNSGKRTEASAPETGLKPGGAIKLDFDLGMALRHPSNLWD